MNQTLHIFAKDTRRFWPEIIISICLLAAFAYVLPAAAESQIRRDPSSILFSILEPILYVLIPISWWVLTSRVVHEENLVGDRQFWITRPYEWPSLLAAKTLFLGAFVLVPVGLMQAAILSVTGFHVASLLPNLLFSVFLLGLMAIFPLAALSTVTPSFAKLTVTLLGIVIAVLIFGSLLIPRAAGNIGFTPHAGSVYLLIAFAGCAAIVLLQYARRRTLIARLILAAMILLLVLWPIFFSTSLMSLYFPAPADPATKSITVALDPTQKPSVSGTSKDNSGESVDVSLPVVVSGLAPGSISALEAVKVTLTTASGLKYSGPWRSRGPAPYLPGGSEALQLAIPKSFFDRVGANPLNLQIRVGVTVLRSEATTTIPFPSGRTEVPNIGICSGNPNFIDKDNSSYGLSCTSALRSPAYTFVTARWSDIRCNQPQPPVDQLIQGDVYTGSFDSDPADFGLSPLVQQQIGFSNGSVPLPNNAVRQRYLCPGTPVTFTRYSIAHRTAVEFTVPDIRLDNLPSNNFGLPHIEMKSIGPNDQQTSE